MERAMELTMNRVDELTEKDLDEASGGWGVLIIAFGLGAWGTGDETHDPKLKNQSNKL